MIRIEFGRPCTSKAVILSVAVLQAERRISLCIDAFKCNSAPLLCG
jgi:hypothetical protein